MNVNAENVEIPTEDGELLCVICHEKIGAPNDNGDREHPVQLECRHVFGNKCLDRCLAARNSCPICRTVVEGYGNGNHSDDDDSQANSDIETGGTGPGVDAISINDSDSAIGSDSGSEPVPEVIVIDSDDDMDEDSDDDSDSDSHQHHHRDDASVVSTMSELSEYPSLTVLHPTNVDEDDEGNEEDESDDDRPMDGADDDSDEDEMDDDMDDTHHWSASVGYQFQPRMFSGIQPPSLNLAARSRMTGFADRMRHFHSTMRPMHHPLQGWDGDISSDEL